MKRGPKRLKISKEELVDLYTKKKFTIRQIAYRFSCASSVVSSRLREYNIPTKLGPREAVDLSGQVFGEWLVLNRHRDTENRVKFLCRCLSCQSECVVLAQNLVSGRSKRCKKCHRDAVWQGCGDISKAFWGSIIRSAKLRNIHFNLTMKEVWQCYEKQGGVCKLSGVPIILCANRHKRTASLDRIDSIGIYEKNNIQWVHKDVNLMKLNFSESYFIDMCRRIYENSKPQA